MTPLLIALLVLIPGPRHPLPVKAVPRVVTTNCGPTSAAAWRAVFDAQPILGDGMISVPGACAFLTGDAVPRSNGPWAHSSITLVHNGVGHVVTPNHPGSQSPYQFIPDGVDGSYHWFGPAVYNAGVMWAFAPRNQVTTDWPYFASLGTDLVRASFVAGKDPVYSGTYATPTPPTGVTWGASAYYDWPYVYIFGTSTAATDGWTGHDAYLARVPFASITNPGAWRYRSDSAWVADPAQATPILTATDGGGLETAFTSWKDKTGWHLASRLGGAWGPAKSARWTSADLVDWTRVETADLPQDAYLVQEHPELPLASGKALLTYNQTGQESTFLEV